MRKRHDAYYDKKGKKKIPDDGTTNTQRILDEETYGLYEKMHAKIFYNDRNSTEKMNDLVVLFQHVICTMLKGACEKLTAEEVLRISKSLDKLLDRYLDHRNSL